MVGAIYNHFLLYSWTTARLNLRCVRICLGYPDHYLIFYSEVYRNDEQADHALHLFGA